MAEVVKFNFFAVLLKLLKRVAVVNVNRFFSVKIEFIKLFSLLFIMNFFSYDCRGIG